MAMPTLTEPSVTVLVSRPGYQVTELPALTLETCDRCGPGTIATTRVATVRGNLTFCTHHALAFGFRRW